MDDNKPNKISRKVYKRLYRNLRKNYQRTIDTVLGKQYYNMGMDVYTCDEYCADDLIRKFKELNSSLKMYKTLVQLLSLVSIVMVILTTVVVVGNY